MKFLTSFNVLFLVIFWPTSSWILTQDNFIIASGGTFFTIFSILTILFLFTFFSSITIHLISNLMPIKYKEIYIKLTFAILISLSLNNILSIEKFWLETISLSIMFIIFFIILNSNRLNDILNFKLIPILISVIFIILAISKTFSLDNQSTSFFEEINTKTIDLGQNRTLVFIFDEFPLFSLLHNTGEFNENLTNISYLKSNSTWIKETIASSVKTRFAIPAMLNPYDTELNNIPSHSNYPSNLFFLMSHHKQNIKVNESITSMCHPKICGDKTNLSIILYDLLVLSAYKLVPKNLQNILPDINNQWNNFMHRGDMRFKIKQQHQMDKPKDFKKFISSINKKDNFIFYHMLFPHDPYTYTKTFQTYGTKYPKINPDKTWNKIGEEIEYQKYFAQLLLLDNLIGYLINELKNKDLWNSSNIIITSDHGASFRINSQKRVMDKKNVEDLVYVPFFIKIRNQDKSQEIDKPFSHTNFYDLIKYIHFSNDPNIEEFLDNLSKQEIICRGNKNSTCINLTDKNVDKYEFSNLDQTKSSDWLKSKFFWDNQANTYLPNRNKKLFGNKLETYSIIDSDQFKQNLKIRSKKNTKEFKENLITGAFESSPDLETYIFINDTLIGKPIFFEGKNFYLYIPDKLISTKNEIKIFINSGNNLYPVMEFEI